MTTLERRLPPSGLPLSRKYFVTAAKGTEVALRDELRSLRFPKIRADRGGVHFEAGRNEACRACLETRVGMRVLEELGSFEAPTPTALYDGVHQIDFAPYVDASRTLKVRATVASSAITHSQFVAQKVKDAVVDQVRDRTGARPNVDLEDADLNLFVRLKRDVATVYADISGKPLHIRGYRQNQLEAPLKETLAAAMVRLVAYDGVRPFVDPMCGSGTIAIEAAMASQGISPGLSTARFGFERWPSHDRTEVSWTNDLRDEARARKKAGPEVLASDLDERALQATRENARRAGVEVRTELLSVEDSKLVPQDAIVVTNPPYGGRLELDLEGARRIGRALANLPGQRLGVIAGAREVLEAIPRNPESIHPVMNGDIECRFAVYSLGQRKDG